MNALALAVLFAIAPFVPALQTGDTVPALPLVDQDGIAFDFHRFAGNSVIVSFIYTRCADPAMCPLVSAKFARLQARIGPAHVRLLEISLDPSFDTPRVLKRYGAAFGQLPARWTLATGAAASIDDLADRLGIATRWTAPGALVHTESVIVLDPSSRIVDVIDGNRWDPADVLASARAAADASPSLTARARLWLGAAVEACGGGRARIPAVAVLLVLAGLIGTCAFLLLSSLRLSSR